MLQLSTYSDDSFRVLTSAALRNPAWVTGGEVAAAFGIPCHRLGKVVPHLGQTGLLQTHRGIRGGFTASAVPFQTQNP